MVLGKTYVSLRIAVICLYRLTPAISTLHYCICSKTPPRFGRGHLDWAVAIHAAKRIYPIGNASKILITDIPFIESSIEIGKAGTVWAAPNGRVVGCNRKANGSHSF